MAKELGAIGRLERQTLQQVGKNVGGDSGPGIGVHSGLRPQPIDPFCQLIGFGTDHHLHHSPRPHDAERAVGAQVFFVDQIRVGDLDAQPGDARFEFDDVVVASQRREDALSLTQRSAPGSPRPHWAGATYSTGVRELAHAVDNGGSTDGVKDVCMNPLRGLGVSPGRAYGPVVRMTSATFEPAPSRTTTDHERACARIDEASDRVAADLTERAERAEGASAELLATTAQIAKDPTLLADAKRLTRARKVTPERAIWDSAGAVTEKFASLGGYFAARVPDVCDVRDRLIAHLTGSPMPGVPVREEPFVLLATDLSPADTASLDTNFVRALITIEGGPTSHTAILARELGIPAVVGIGHDVDNVADGRCVLVDGAIGTVLLDPDTEALASAQSPWVHREFDGVGQTKDGHQVSLFANVGDPAGAAQAAESGAQGVGLFRTEFCFLDRETEPSVAEQIAAYSEVLGQFAGKRVVVRTLDAGADKTLPFLTSEPEINPALGVRGYRTAAAHPGVLDRQLAAIAAAANSQDAEVWVMAPMVSGVAEAEDFVARAAGHGLDMAGVMVEIPSAALLAGPLLARAQFASIGTNDLTQYTLAADRQLGALARMSDSWDPSVLELVRLTCVGGAAQDRPVAVCGEAAADPALAPVLVGLGASTLSMTPSALGNVAAVLSQVTLAQCREAAMLACAAASAADAQAAVRGRLTVLSDLGL